MRIRTNEDWRRESESSRHGAFATTPPTISSPTGCVAKRILRDGPTYVRCGYRTLHHVVGPSDADRLRIRTRSEFKHLESKGAAGGSSYFKSVSAQNLLL